MKARLEKCPLAEYDSEAALGLFSKALVNITTTAQSHEREPVKIGAISYPEVFNATSQKSLLNAATKFDPDFNEESFVWNFWKSVAITHSNSHCITRPEYKEPQKEERDLSVLVINFEQDRAELYIGAVWAHAESSTTRKIVPLLSQVCTPVLYLDRVS